MTSGVARSGRQGGGVVVSPGPGAALGSLADPGSLADLAVGSRALVVEIVPGGSATTAERLGELGFTPGTTVEVVRRAPLRDPVVYRLKDYEICLRRAQAACIRTTELR